MTLAFLGLLVWLLVALALGVLIGRAMERADAAEQPDDFAKWEAEQRHPSGREWIA
jgi:hypothetical protein